jgi:hypothetical protein
MLLLHMLYKNTARLWQREQVFISNRRALPTRFGKSFLIKVTSILIHVICCMMFHLQLFLTVFKMSAMTFSTVSLITCIFPLLKSDVAFSSLSANATNNSHQCQTLISSVSWMKATETGLITRVGQRICANLEVSSIHFQKWNLIMNFS